MIFNFITFLTTFFVFDIAGSGSNTDDGNSNNNNNNYNNNNDNSKNDNSGICKFGWNVIIE